MRKITLTLLLVLAFGTAAYAQQPLSGRYIGIDPGHSAGVNKGATDLYEGDLTLATAFDLKKYLEAAGASVFMTRTTGADVGLTARVNSLNAAGVNIAVSIHYNAAGPTNNDTMAFVRCNRCGTTSATLAGDLVQRLATISSRHIASAPATNFICSTGPLLCTQSGVGTSDVTILTTVAPSALPEVSNLSNPTEEDRLRSADYVDLNAWLLYAAISDYYGVAALPRAGGSTPPTVQLNSASTSTQTTGTTSTFTINYSVTSSAATSVMLGASLRLHGTTNTPISDPPHDSLVSLPAGTSSRSRQFSVSAAAGVYDLIVAIWRDQNGNGSIDSADLQLSALTYQSYETLTATQVSCSYSFSPPSAPGSGSGGSSTILVSGSPSGCTGSWSASPNSTGGWLSLSGTTSQNGPGTWNLGYSYPSNPSTSASRVGTVSFNGAFSSGNTFTLTQNPSTPGACSYSISPPATTGPASGGIGNVQVTGSPSGCTGSWTASASSTGNWLTLTGTANGSGPGPTLVPYSFIANPNASTRPGSIQFSGSFSSTFTLTQDASVVTGGGSDTCSSAVVASGSSFTHAQNTSSSTSEVSDPASCLGSGGASVWYRYTAPGSGTVTVDTIGSDYDTVLATFTGSCGALATVPNGCDDDSGGNATSRLTFPVSSGVTYYFMVTAYFGTGGSLTFHLTTSASPDTIAPVGSFVINNGTLVAASTSVLLSMSASDAVGVVGYYASNSSSVPSAGQAGWSPVGSTTSLFITLNGWQLPAGDGVKTVYVWYKDAAGNVSGTASATIILDQTAPPNGALSAVPGDRQVLLTWNGQTDATSGLASYKLVFAVGSTPPADCSGSAIATATPFIHAGLNNQQPYAYRLCAADVAGNLNSGATATATPTATPVTKARNDFNGDGRSDILWRNSLTGSDYLYQMNGLTIATLGEINVTSDQNWKIVGTGDFDGDGKADVLWRHSVTGANYMYLMNGLALVGAGQINTVADPNWNIVGVGDFDGDGKADILWRNSVTGSNYMYLMNGMSIKALGEVNVIADQNWQIVGVADFDGDGKADILWRNSVTGSNYMYLMNGMSIRTLGQVNVIGDQNWKVVGAGDFDGDGKADILWRNLVTGDDYIYEMNGFTIKTPGAVNTVNDPNWSIVATGDYNGDGKADILWRNNVTGSDYMYLMNGFSIVTLGQVNVVNDPNWKIVY
ncbi:MAG: hypothetical protein QOK37_1758 [Thermoanaerobaculia bacterium]|jgi:N-acetylmuramoyl-L-alanine amidase|nr:hypothetical protein [Thermoanaerobaculia bacterium]